MPKSINPKINLSRTGFCLHSKSIGGCGIDPRRLTILDAPQKTYLGKQIKLQTKIERGMAGRQVFEAEIRIPRRIKKRLAIQDALIQIGKLPI